MISGFGVLLLSSVSVVVWCSGLGICVCRLM